GHLPLPLLWGRSDVFSVLLEHVVAARFQGLFRGLGIRWLDPRLFISVICDDEIPFLVHPFIRFTRFSHCVFLPASMLGSDGLRRRGVDAGCALAVPGSFGYWPKCLGPAFLTPACAKVRGVNVSSVNPGGLLTAD